MTIHAQAQDSRVLEFAASQGAALPVETLSLVVKGAPESFDPHFLKEAAKAVLHYFRNELGREHITVGEFIGALETVLGRVEFGLPPSAEITVCPREAHTNLDGLVGEAGSDMELAFFARLRQELKSHLEENPSVLRFSGLRDCGRRLLGRRRRGERCRELEDQIVAYLRQCLLKERSRQALVIE